MQNEHKIQWHPAFYAATELEFREDSHKLQFTYEYNLSKQPIRIDMLIVKRKDNELLNNEIGHIMRTYNIVEYKGSADRLTIDTLYKVMGYACLYKGYGKTVNEIPSNEITVSIFRAEYPRELFKELEKSKYKIEEKYSGIYYIYGLQFPTQIVVMGLLSQDKHSMLRVLTRNVNVEDVKAFLKNAEYMTDVREKSNIDAILQVSVSANYDVYRKIRRNEIMCEALRELLKEEIEEDISKGEARGREEGCIDIILNMSRNGFTIQQIVLATGKSEDYIFKIISTSQA